MKIKKVVRAANQAGKTVIAVTDRIPRPLRRGPIKTARRVAQVVVFVTGPIA